jgi:uncharacterized iron-regulated membrane protein
MITYTGLITLMFMYMPSGVDATYKGDQQAFFADVFPTAQRGPAAGRPMALAPIAPIVEQAEQQWKGSAASITINHPGDANATVSITRQYYKHLSYLRPSMQFNGTTGALIASHGDTASGAAETRGVLYGLHMAHFSDPLLRFLFFLCGLAGCAMVATGALLWAVKKRQGQAKALAAGARPTFGLRLVEGMNIGVIAGLPIAFAAYFWANRLLPVGLENRIDIEVRCFFIAWAVALACAHIRPARRMWQWLLAFGGFLFMSLPVLNAFTTDLHLGVTLLHGPAVFAGFDLMALLLGSGFAYAAWRLKGGKPNAQKKPLKKPAADEKLMPEAT